MNWIITDWHQLLAEPWATIALWGVAVACGVIVGIEREKREKPAGLRTMTLVSLGAAVFTAEYYIPRESRQTETLEGDRQRLRFTYCNAHKHHKEFLTRLAELAQVAEIRQIAAQLPLVS